MKKLTKRNENYSKWYNEIIFKANIADKSDVRGCMVIKPYGFSIWEKIKFILDKILKSTGHKNVYFPLLIPKSYFSKEYNHIKGFAKECADRKSTRLNSSHTVISYAVFCLKKKKHIVDEHF